MAIARCAGTMVDGLPTVSRITLAVCSLKTPRRWIWGVRINNPTSANGYRALRRIDPLARSRPHCVRCPDPPPTQICPVFGLAMGMKECAVCRLRSQRLPTQVSAREFSYSPGQACPTGLQTSGACSYATVHSSHIAGNFSCVHRLRVQRFAC